MKVFQTKRTRITENFALSLRALEIRNLLNQELIRQKQPSIPEEADIFVSVPGGGDWSNTTLDLAEHDLQIEWTVEREE